MRQRTIAVLALLVLGCLPAFAPNLRARGTHAGLRPETPGETCMSCHVSEHEATLRAPGTRMPAPIVADWMLAESRDCVDCHRVHEPRASRTASLVGVSRAR
jgi:hypothetical protein